MDNLLQNALDAIDEVTASEDLWIEAPLSRGDVQYLNNHELGHYRSDFIDYDDQSKKRHFSDYGIVCPVEFTTTVNQLLILGE